MHASATTAVPRMLPTPLSLTPRPSFRGMVRAELRKLRRQRANWVLLGLFVLLFAGVIVTEGFSTQARTLPPGRLLRLMTAVYIESTASVVGVFLLIGAAHLVGMEYSAGTIRVLLSRGIGRLALLGAKLVALVLSGLVLSLACVAVSAAGLLALVTGWHGGPAWLAGASSADWLGAGAGVLTLLASIAACTLLPVAAAVLGRSTAIAVGVAFFFFPADDIANVVLNLVAPAIHQSWPMHVSEYLLGVNLNALPGQAIGVDAAIAGPVPALSIPHILAVTACWCAAFAAVAIGLVLRRDVTE